MMPADGGHDGNGRVTLAILSTKLDAIIEELKKIDGCNQRQDDRIRGLEDTAITNKTKIEGLGEDVKGLKNRDTITGIVAVVFSSIVTAVVTALKP